MKSTALCATLGVAVLGAMFTGGCGGKSDEDRARATVKAYIGAVADGDGKKACDLLTGSGKRELVTAVNENLPEVGTIECDQVIERMSSLFGSDELDQIKRTKLNVAIHGNTGEAIAAQPDASTRPILLEKVGGDWKLSGGFAFGGSSTP